MSLLEKILLFDSFVVIRDAIIIVTVVRIGFPSSTTVRGDDCLNGRKSTKSFFASIYPIILIGQSSIARARMRSRCYFSHVGLANAGPQGRLIVRVSVFKPYLVRERDRSNEERSRNRVTGTEQVLTEITEWK